MIRLSKDLSLPIDAVTSTFAILAQRGAGKSYCASVMAEDMLEANQRICVLDPTGAWYGLQSSADGKSPGYPIVVIGGDHGNLPLADTAGEVIGRAVAGRRFSAVLDLSHFRKSQMRRFVADFLETLYRLNRDPLHVFIDEADDLCPQRVGPEEARMVGAAEDLVKRGRKRGVGVTLITQRPADLAKQVLTQVSTLINLRMNHPRDIKAIHEWVNVNADTTSADRMIQSLPSLPIGEAWVWSPGADIFQRIHVRRRRTFDSGATPKIGQKVIEPSTLAPIDVQALGAEIEATIQEQKQTDPKALRARIAELERALKQVKPEPMLPPGLKSGLSDLDRAFEQTKALLSKAASTLTEAEAQMLKFHHLTGGDMNGAVARKPVRPELRRAEGAGDLPPPRQRILNALSYMCNLGYPRLDKTQLAFMAGASPRSSAFQNNVSGLHVSGFVKYPAPGLVQLTEAGYKIANDDGPSDNPEYQEMVMGKLSAPQRKMVAALIARYPDSYTKPELAEAVGASVNSSAFQNNVSNLHVTGLVEYPERGSVCAAKLLFPF